MADAEANKERDELGRFTKGNPGGPGGRRRRAFELQRAAEEAVSPEHVAALVRRAVRMGLEGNLSAMRLALERTCGRATDAPVEPESIAIEIPKLLTAADCAAAIDRLIEAHLDGTVGERSTQLLLAAVQTRLRAIEITDLEERLEHLEQTAGCTAGRRR